MSRHFIPTSCEYLSQFGHRLALYLFSIGQDVSLHSSIFVPASSQGVQRIIAILPNGGEEPRYLIKFGAGPGDPRRQPARHKGACR